VLKATITLVFESAVAQPTFCAMYADLCLHLSREVPEFPPGEGDVRPIKFKRVLLNTCQDEFEGVADAREVRRGVALRCAGPRTGPLHTPCIWQPAASCRRVHASRAHTRRARPTHAHPTAPQELSNITDAEERAAAEKRVKMRTMGTVRLISELFRQEVVKENIILVCIRELLEAANPKSVPPEVRPPRAARPRAAPPQWQRRARLLAAAGFPPAPPPLTLLPTHPHPCPSRTTSRRRAR
jgi:translation initiation factor 4G